MMPKIDLWRLGGRVACLVSAIGVIWLIVIGLRSCGVGS